jgi:hypothetical protein
MQVLFTAKRVYRGIDITVRADAGDRVGRNILSNAVHHLHAFYRQDTENRAKTQTQPEAPQQFVGRL